MKILNCSFIVGKGLDKVAKALYYHQKEFQIAINSNKEVNMEEGLWGTSIFIRALETSVDNPDELTKLHGYDVLAEWVRYYYHTCKIDMIIRKSLTNAKINAVEYLASINGTNADRVKDNIKRIEKIEKSSDKN